MDIKAIAVTGAAYLILLVLLWKTGKGKIRNREKKKADQKGNLVFLSCQHNQRGRFYMDGTGQAGERREDWKKSERRRKPE